MARSGPDVPARGCPLIGLKRTSLSAEPRSEIDPNRSRSSLPTTDRLRGPRCLLTASCRYDMLMFVVEENGFHGMLPNCGGETGTAT
jgi:hypothetical protein